LAVRLTCNNDSLQSKIANPVLQLAAGDLAMVKVAFAEEKLQTKLSSLKVANEQKNIDEFFKGKKITFVLDYDLMQEELDQDLTFSLDFDLEMYVN
jgi:homospermidine synthase